MIHMKCQCQSLFSGKNKKKKIINLSSAEFAQRAVRDNSKDPGRRHPRDRGQGFPTVTFLLHVSACVRGITGDKIQYY